MIETKALHIWMGLELAKDGKHPYGEDITEIYPLHLIPEEPVGNPWMRAGKTLYELLKQFCQLNRVWASIDGRRMGEWMNEYKFFHKCDVRIFEDKQEEVVDEPLLAPIFQSKQSEDFFRTIENAILRDKEEKQRAVG